MAPIIMSILGWMMFGLIVGVVPKLLVPKYHVSGMIVTMALGIVGALIGGVIGLILERYWAEDLLGSFMAVIGAMAVLFFYRRAVAS